MQLKQIRSTFLEYFARNGHKVEPSSPLVPHNDPSLMFTNAGMVQFKNYFTGAETAPFSRAVTSQKCVRAGGKHNDLENVGYTARHHTFFEMLGNFSFGDYFKEDAIKFAWDCLTKDFAIDKSKLYVTVYHDDQEAFDIWRKVAGFGEDRIIRINSNDNFWAMGDTGPCGPCSEIFFDNGESVPGGLPGTAEQDGDRYKEIWNLVFMQFEDLPGGQRIKLPKPSIDTGMGLERIAAVLQGKLDNFDIDLFQRLIEASKNASRNYDDSVSHRVIADHLRSTCFLIADGVMPSNEGRGYVLRRIMRRAMRHIYHLGVKEPMMYRLVPALISEMGEVYSELKRAEGVITSTIKLEEERFMQTLDKGMRLLGDATSHMGGGSTMDGAVAFKLYDTYGFPLDLTQDILRGKNIEVDTASFEAHMQDQRQRAKAAWAGSGEKATEQLWFNLIEKVGTSEFLGYNSVVAEGIITAIIQDGQELIKASSGEAWVVLNQTPFYAESGGQIFDIGKLGGCSVTDTQKFAGAVIAHKVLVNTELKINQVVRCEVDHLRRDRIRANHSATHLLHHALRNILGEHVTQKGSLVEAERLRFDFSQPTALTVEQIIAVEKMVNSMVIANQSVATELMTPDDAIEKGAMALFGEKYGAEVRVVSMGDSLELCGGTHVSATGDIGLFKITAESAVAAGVRRIEAVTGIAALECCQGKELILKELNAQFKCGDDEVINRVASLILNCKTLEKDLAQLRINSIVASGIESENIAGVPFFFKQLDGVGGDAIKQIADAFKAKYKDGIYLLISINEGKVSVVVAVTESYQGRFKAGELVKIAATELGGNGGGRPDFAQAGGSKIEALPEAIAKIKNQIIQG